MRKEQLQPIFSRLFAGLSPDRQKEIRIIFDAGHPLREKTDLLLYMGDTLMAAGSWSHRIAGRSERTNQEKLSTQCARLMALETMPWYLFEFDGTNLLIYDLSEDQPMAEISSDLIMGIRRLCTVPDVWKSQQTQLASMQRYVHTLLALVNEEQSMA